MSADDAAANAPAPKATSSLKDMTAGIFGGMALVAAGHPFDTIKVRLQTQPTPPPGQAPMFTGFVDCLLKTIRRESVLGLYKGMSSPLVGVPPIYAICFWGYGFSKNLLRPADGSDLSITRLAIAGGMSGIFTTVVTAPVEQIKARLQVQYNRPAGEPAQYKGPIDCARQIVARKGIPGLFQGSWPTLVRDVPGSAAYFGGYEITKKLLGGSDGKVSVGVSLVSGGMAGVINWLAVYPLDVIKSRIQTQSHDNPQYSGIIDCYRKMVAREGYRSLFKGLTPALIRSFPANAACFAAYEAAMRFLNWISP